MTIREIKIQEQLETLYTQLEAFDEPTPAEAPFEYEVEELESWEKLREQIRVLEHELTAINITWLKSAEQRGDRASGLLRGMIGRTP